MHHASVMLRNKLGGCGLMLLVASVAGAADKHLAQFSDGPDVRWERDRERSGVVLEKRAVEGSNYREYRVVVDRPLDPKCLTAAIWQGLKTGIIEGLLENRVLRESGNELVVYAKIDAPVVKDRDFTLIANRDVDSHSRNAEIRITAANALGPPKSDNYARVETIFARWLVEPHDSKTRLAYYVYSEVGSQQVARFARERQASGALKVVLDIVGQCQNRGD
jgi:hypothetical protein